MRWAPTLGALVALAFGLGGGTPAASQEATLAIGYTKLPGRVGGPFSDRGPAVRLGADLTGGSTVRFGVELGLDRLNLDRREVTQTCFLPSGGTGTCHFETESRDVAIGLSAHLRVQTPTGTVRPYGLMGLGYLNVREHSRVSVTDSAGNRLTNFEFDGTSSDGSLQGHVGAGLVLRPNGFRLGIMVEGRLSYSIHNYSGGLVADWQRTVLTGVRVPI